MAILHQAELHPSKLEVVQAWAPSQPWYPTAQPGALSSVGAFRFDDPDGEVGVETLLVRVGDGPVLQVPLTYRGAPLPGGEPALVGTMEHSVLGHRWVYDGTGDPVYLATLAAAALTGGTQAELMLQDGDQQVRREPTALVRGSGTPGTPVPPIHGDRISRHDEGGWTVVATDALLVTVARRPGSGIPWTGGHSSAPTRAEPTGTLAELTGTWAGQTTPVTLATVTVL